MTAEISVFSVYVETLLSDGAVVMSSGIDSSRAWDLQ